MRKRYSNVIRGGVGDPKNRIQRYVFSEQCHAYADNMSSIVHLNLIYLSTIHLHLDNQSSATAFDVQYLDLAVVRRPVTKESKS